ncbi:MAG: hypothetical protein JOY71_25045 [Acetobacteraceae bacterium]|nr:hypothetical protein [Acetobacteraceae bacterium]
MAVAPNMFGLAEYSLVPLPVAVPLAVAAVLLIFAHVWPRLMPDIIAILTAFFAASVCVLMAVHAKDGPLVYWFGNWTPRAGLVLGIGFVADQIDCAASVLISILFAATLIFAWGYFSEVHAHFHVLMLLFMAAMIGFCLTHDVFNMFVWFEVMSVAGFALTGYRLEASALEGALNFTVTNSIGSFLMLGGIGLIYSKAGALDFAALAQAINAGAQRSGFCWRILPDSHRAAHQGRHGSVSILAFRRPCCRPQPGIGYLFGRNGWGRHF